MAVDVRLKRSTSMEVPFGSCTHNTDSNALGDCQCGTENSREQVLCGAKDAKVAELI
jgi:hypothetical protein